MGQRRNEFGVLVVVIRLAIDVYCLVSDVERPTSARLTKPR